MADSSFKRFCFISAALEAKDYALIKATFSENPDDIIKRLIDLHETKTSLKHRISDLEQEVEKHKKQNIGHSTQISKLNAQQDTLIEIVGELTKASKSQPYPDPDEYHAYRGEKSELEQFVKKMAIKLRVNKDWYPTEQDRMAYFVSRLRDSALEAALPGIRMDGTLDYENVDKIVALL